MIEVKTEYGCTSIHTDGSGLEILTDLTLINARIIVQTEMPDELVKYLFEGTLRAVKMIKEGEAV